MANPIMMPKAGITVESCILTKWNVKVGDTVKVCDGPLEGFLGTVDELDAEKDLVRVIVSMFGRETPIDLELDQVETIKD